MEAKIRLNRNVACASRGLDPDVPTETVELKIDSLQDLADYLEDEHAIVVDEEAVKGELTLKDIVNACNDIDPTGGDTIVFWIEVDDEHYGTYFESDEREWDEEDDGSYEDDYGCDLDDPLEFTLSAVIRAFPFEDIGEENEHSKAAWIIARWYDAEGACEDFEMGDEDGAEEFADYIRDDIENMLDAADEGKKKDLVLKVLREIGVIDPEVEDPDEEEE